jgi:hypothetical protein
MLYEFEAKFRLTSVSRFQYLRANEVEKPKVEIVRKLRKKKKARPKIFSKSSGPFNIRWRAYENAISIIAKEINQV